MIEARIVRIVDDRTIVINAGAEAGVSPGQEFVIIQPVDAVTDPATDEELGVWEMVKARVVATHVQPKMTTLSPVGSPATQGMLLSEQMTMSPLGVPIGSTDEPLAVDRSQMSGTRRKEMIRLGDVVRSVA